MNWERIGERRSEESLKNGFAHERCQVTVNTVQ